MINLYNVLSSPASVRVHAHWEPIADATFNMHNDSPELAEVFDLSPRHPVKEYGAEDFKVFLPLSTVAVGDVWALDPNNIVPFLYQFHPGAKADLGNGEEGAYACLRACSSDYAEIVFRVHTEFTLGSDTYQEWQREHAEEGWEPESEANFIPSQYVGQVLVNLKKGTIRAFSLALPVRNSNVDINACGGADMVFVPRMELLTISHPVKEYGAEDFKVFLPLSTVAVGDVWAVDPNSIVPFLYQFHPGAKADLGNGEEGAYACLRACSSDYAEIVFRVHTEFTLGSDTYQEWQQENAEEGCEPESEATFIPSQYVGQVLVNLKKGTIRAFSLALPARNSNVDINACGGADMVFVPRMELLTMDETDQDEIAWNISITVEEARRSLELKFYKFAEIDWVPIERAVELASTARRPIHAVLVWGCLDDESC